MNTAIDSINLHKTEGSCSMQILSKIISLGIVRIEIKNISRHIRIPKKLLLFLTPCKTDWI